MNRHPTRSLRAFVPKPLLAVLLVLFLVSSVAAPAAASSGWPPLHTVSQPPNPPVLVSPANGSFINAGSTSLRAQVSDPDGGPLTVSFYVRPLSFTLVHIPDTQRLILLNKVQGITNWIVANRVERNIPYAVQVGDVTETDTAGDWQSASSAFSILEDPQTTGLPDGVPYGILAGNHDAIANFDAYFPVSRFAGRSYYGGHYPSNSNQNNYGLFSAGGMDFLAVNLSECPDQNEIDWAESLIKANPARRAIVSTHTLFPWVVAPTWHPCGEQIFNSLSDNPSFFLLLGGHSRMEARRQDVGLAGQTVYSLIADFTNQNTDHIRLMTFSPSEDLIRVRTYSPEANTYQTDADSQFDLPYDMSAAGFGLVGTVSGVASGATVQKTVYGLIDGVEYEWYVVVSDGSGSTTGATWRFTNSSSPPQCYTLTRGHTGQGSDPTASPANSSGCAAGKYRAGESIALSGASPAPGWEIAGWTGTSDDASKAATNSLTMPAAARTVEVRYTQPEYQLSITVAGQGAVTDVPGNPYTQGETATLTPMPAQGWTFQGWSGPDAAELVDAGGGAWTLLMDGNKAVTATFADVTAPDTTITASPADPTNSADAAFEFTSTEGNSTFACALDGGTFAPCVSPVEYAALPDGAHTFQVRATDSWGNTDPTPAAFAWTIDTLAPDTDLDAHPANPTNSPDATFEFSSPDAGASFECRLDAGAWTPCASPHAYTALPDGNRTFAVRAKDAAGNVDPSPAGYAWTIDASPFTLDALALRESPDQAAWTSVHGDLEQGYTVSLDPGSEWRHLDVAALDASHTLAAGYYGFTLDQADLPAGWLAYWAAKGVTSDATEPWQQQMWLIINGDAPIFHLRIGAGEPALVDGLLRALGQPDTYLRVNGDYPLGAYVYRGSITDIYGAPLSVSTGMTFIGPGAPAAPVVTPISSGANVRLTWPPVTADVTGRFTSILIYQVFRGEAPYFLAGPDSLVAETTATEYLQSGAAGGAGALYYIVRAVNIVSPSADSSRTAVFRYGLTAGTAAEMQAE